MTKYIKILRILLNISIIALNDSTIQCSKQDNSNHIFIKHFLKTTAPNTLTPETKHINDILNESSIEFINKQDINGNSLLHLAAQFGHAEIIEKLQNKAHVNMKNRNGDTALHLAVANKQILSTNALLKIGIQPLNKNLLNQMPIDIAITNKDSDMFYTLLPFYSANIPINEYGTLLHFAAINDNAELVNILLENGANINIANSQGINPITLAYNLQKANAFNAFFHDFQNSENYTIYQKLNAKIINEIESKNPNIDKIKNLLEFATPELIQAYDLLGNNPIHFAAYYNYPEIIELLINHGFNKNSENINKETPLNLAIKNNSIDSFNKLLSNKANPYLPNNQGLTLMDIAVNNNAIPIVKILRNINNNNTKISFIDPKTNKKNTENLWFHILRNNNMELLHVLIETSTDFSQILTDMDFKTFQLLMKNIDIIELKHSKFKKDIDILKNEFNKKIGTIDGTITEDSYEIFKELLLIVDDSSLQTQRKKDIALQFALKYESFESVQILLHYGANPNNVKFKLKNPNILIKRERKINDLLTFYQQFNKSEEAQKYRQTENDVKIIISLYEQYIQDHNPEKLHQALISDNTINSTIAIKEKSKVLFALYPFNGIDKHIEQLIFAYIHWKQYQKLNAQIVEEIIKEKPNINNIKKLLTNNNNQSLLNAKDHYGQVPLHIAAHLNANEVITLLREHGADPNITDITGNTPLHIAALYNNKEAIIAFNNDHKSNIKALNKKFEQDTDKSNSLIEKTTTNFHICTNIIDLIQNIKNNESLTPIQIAIKYENFKALSALIDHLDLKKTDSTDPLDNNIKYSADQELLNKMLLRATDDNHIKLMKVLLEKGADRYYVDTTFQSKSIVQVTPATGPSTMPTTIPITTTSLPLVLKPKRLHSFNVAAMGYTPKTMNLLLNYHPLPIINETDFEKESIAKAEALGTAINFHRQEIIDFLLDHETNPNNQTVTYMLNVTSNETFKANIKKQLEPYQNLNFSEQAIQNRKKMFGIIIMDAYKIYLNDKDPKPLLDILAPDPKLKISPLVTQKAENLFANPEKLKLNLILDYQKLITNRSNNY